MSRVDGIRIRVAQREDVPVIVRLLADDALGRERECFQEPLPSTYWKAFDALTRDSRNLLLVAERSGGAVVGYLQVTFLPGLSFRGAERALIEDVRVDSTHRSQGIGRSMLEWVLAEARSRGCRLVELFVHETRSDARRFYIGLGFRGSHTGMRLLLE